MNRQEHAHKEYTLWHVTAVGSLILLGLLLIVDHWNHVVSALPYLLLLACPLMHLFMHGGHGHHHNEQDK